MGWCNTVIAVSADFHVTSHSRGWLYRYVLLTSIQSLYAYFIEGNIVYVGKRKTYTNRVSPSLEPYQELPS